MRSSLKCLLLYLIVGVTLLNIYFLIQIYFRRHLFSTSATLEEAELEQQKERNHDGPTDDHHQLHQKGLGELTAVEQVSFIHQKRKSGSSSTDNDNEYLILDWTGQQHVFREQDTIQCNFSHITPSYCASKFETLSNEALRLQLIQRCNSLRSLKIRWTDDQTRLAEADLVAYHSIHMPSSTLPKLEQTDARQQFSTVYVLESEVHSSGGQDWHEVDFPMWYNLEKSYPEPATYFDLVSYLNQLFAPPRVPFNEKKKDAIAVWIISNCNAYNGRQSLIEALMSHIRIDSFGGCLNTAHSPLAQQRGEGVNAQLYSQYKFVISIENSNCEDYITEKLIHALSSTSVPIVASRGNIPDYSRVAPNHSVINVYDFDNVKKLADYLIYLSQNETAYNEYLWFRRPPFNNQTNEKPLLQRNMAECRKLAHEILGDNATMNRWLVAKETSVNKYCKLAQYVKTTYWKLITKRKKSNRPTPSEVCLPANDIAKYFQPTQKNLIS